MRVFLCFLERSENSLSLSYCAFVLILHYVQSTEFCEIIISLNQNLGYYFCRGGLFGVLVCCLCSMDEMLVIFPCFRQIDYYPYATLEVDRWFRCNGLHRPNFPTMVDHTVSSGLGVARPMWTSRLTPLTQP
jgi:hypothetical protein